VRPSFGPPLPRLEQRDALRRAAACERPHAAQRENVSPTMRERITALEHFEAAQKRNELGLVMSRFHERYDLLVTPTLAVAAFDVGREAPKNAKGWVSWTPFTFPFNLTQQPAASIPCGLTRTGLPVGLHIIGLKYAEAQVLRAARAFEVAHPFAMPDLSKLAK